MRGGTGTTRWWCSIVHALHAVSTGAVSRAASNAVTIAGCYQNPLFLSRQQPTEWVCSELAKPGSPENHVILACGYGSALAVEKARISVIASFMAAGSQASKSLALELEKCCGQLRQGSPYIDQTKQ
jgi:hypothetical protein